MNLNPGFVCRICLVGIGILLSSCSDNELVEQRVAELNARIDKLALSDEERSIKAKSLSEIELQVKNLEEDRSYQIKNFLRRESLAAKRIASLEAEMSDKLAKIKTLEAAAESYDASTSGQRVTNEERIAALMKKLEASVDLTPKPGQEKVIVLERLLQQIDALKAENATLREALAKK